MYLPRYLRQYALLVRFSVGEDPEVAGPFEVLDFLNDRLYVQQRSSEIGRTVLATTTRSADRPCRYKGKEKVLPLGQFLALLLFICYELGAGRKAKKKPEAGTKRAIYKSYFLYLCRHFC